MKVKILKYDENAQIPSQAYSGDFCYDCYAVSEEEVAPNVWKYDLGIGLQISRGVETIENPLITVNELGDIYRYYGGRTLNFAESPIKLSIDARPRSSVWKTGMSLANCEGTIDEGYLNSISAVFYHVLPNMPRYRVGDKVCQIKLGFTLPIEFVEVDNFDDTERGMNGYGSSGR